jgi:methanogenic corrinoid protein MtbC1
MAQEEWPPASFGTGAVDRAGDFRSAAVRAAECLAARELQGVLERATVSLGVPVFLEQVASPSIQEIGHRWTEGTISIGQEHLATAVFRRVLGWIIDTFEAKDATARMVVGTPSGQAHELGALMAAAAAAVEGWDIIYLGADLPADEVIKGVKQTDARAVALSIVRPTTDPALFEQLTSIREGVGRDVDLFLGGAAVAQEPERFRTTGARVFDSLDQFRAVLRGMAEQGS